MLISCDKHNDYLVNYDYPIIKECPACMMKKELEEDEKKYEDKIEKLEDKNELKEKQIVDLRKEVQKLREKGSAFFDRNTDML